MMERDCTEQRQVDGGENDEAEDKVVKVRAGNVGNEGREGEDSGR